MASSPTSLLVFSKDWLECYSRGSLKKVKNMALDTSVLDSCQHEEVVFMLMSDQSIQQYYPNQALFQGTIKGIHFDRQGLKVQGKMCYVKSSEEV